MDVPEMSEINASHEKLHQTLALLQKDPRNDLLWKDLYEQIRRYVYAVAYRVLNGRAELAKDATQIVFLRLFQYCEFTEFSEPEEFLGYVGTISRHAALDLIRSEGGYVTGLEVTLCDFLPGRVTPQQHEQAQNQLDDILERLESEDKKLVELLMEGFTLDEIGARLGVSYAAAAVRTHRLRQKLLKFMKKG
jgi:RNA polymerase sigma factor (sigma-70 family)